MCGGLERFLSRHSYQRSPVSLAQVKVGTDPTSDVTFRYVANNTTQLSVDLLADGRAHESEGQEDLERRSLWRWWSAHMLLGRFLKGSWPDLEFECSPPTSERQNLKYDGTISRTSTPDGSIFICSICPSLTGSYTPYTAQRAEVPRMSFGITVPNVGSRGTREQSVNRYTLE